MADTGATLLSQILDAPDDDAPKHVYADWLEEQGNPAAAVIRASMAGKRLPKNKFLDEVKKQVDEKATFERGMVGDIYCGAGKYVSKTSQAALMKVASTFGIRRTTLRGQSAKVPSCETLAFTPDFFWWDCQADDALVGALADSPHVSHVTALSLEKLRCSNKGLGKIARSKRLARVTQLGLLAPVALGNFDATGVIGILNKLPIEQLEMTRGPFRLSFGPIANAPSASQLVSLGVTAGRDAAGILNGKALTGLRDLRLDLYDTPKGDDFKAFLKSKTFSKLERLELSHPHHQPLDASIVAALKKRFGKNLTYRN